MNYLHFETPSEMARTASLKNESFMQKARNGVKCSLSVMSPGTQICVGQMSVSFKGWEQVMQADFIVGWSSLLVEGPVSEERVPALVVFNSGEGGCLRGANHRAGVKIRNLQQAGWGLRSRTSPWSTCSNCLPSLIVRALLIMLCKSWEMDFTFPPARLCTALHLLSPFKNTESSEKGNGSFLFVHQQSWHRPVKQSSWAVICKAALCRLIPQPPRLFTRHTQTSARLKTSYFVIRQNLSAWVMKVVQRWLTSHQINLELCPQHLVLIPMAEW